MAFATLAQDAALLFADPQRLARELPLLRAWVDGGERLLDVGCGSGDHLAGIASQCRIAVGIDPEPSMCELARSRHPQLDIRSGGAEQPPAGPWDRISLLGNVLGCVPDPAAALRALAAQLHPDGSLLIQVPNRAAGTAGDSRLSSRYDAEGGIIVAKVLHHLGDQFLLDLLHHRRQADGSWQHQASHQRLHAFTAAGLEALAAASGLRIRHRYGQLSGVAASPDSPDLITIMEHPR